MPFQSRFVTTTRGAITITGNTLGLSKSTTGTLTPGTADAIGSFITTDTSVPTAVGWGAIVNLANSENLTLDWTLNSSIAQLNILPGSTVLYAELIWGASYIAGNGILPIENVSLFINDAIRFTVPGGTTYNVSPTPITTYDDGLYYSHSANVTPFINGSGTYKVSRVPGALSTSDLTGAYAGWSLIVVYENSTLPIRNMTVFAGAEPVFSGQTVDTTIAGFSTPAFGPLNARISVSAIEGDANRQGDFMQFGPSTLNLTKLFGPNNQANPPDSFDNFFNSAINNGNPNSGTVGQVDTTGTFGNRNHSPATLTNNIAGRQGWDVTNVNGSAALINGQTTAVVRFATQGDVYIPNGIAVQIDVASPTINITKATPNTVIYSGDTIQYTLTVTNTGSLTTNNGFIFESIPTGTTLNVGSINVIGATGPVVNSSNPSNLAIDIGAINIGQTVTITYTLQTNSGTPFPITNFAQIQYDFTPVAGGPTILDKRISNTVNTDGIRVAQTKSASNSQAVSGDIITYTVVIDNTASSTAITSVSLLDTLQAGTTYVPNTTVIGSNPAINVNPGAGINIGTINANSSQTVNFNVLVTSPPAVSPILNTASITFTGAGSTRTQNTNQTSIQIVSPNFTVVKAVDKSSAEGGDTLIYTTVITNTGNIQLNNLIFNDAPPSNTTYNGAGVSIDGILYPSLNPNSPIDLLAVPVSVGTFPLFTGETITISYETIVTSAPAGGQITNTSSATAQYTVGSQQRSDSKTSNTVSTDIFTIDVNKAVNREYVQIGQTYTYTSTITSTTPGTYPNNIIFIDNLPANTTLVPASIVVSGATVTVNNSTSTQINLNFGTLFPNNNIVISFDVLVGSSASGILLNTSSVDIGGIVTNSNTVSTEVSTVIITKSASETFVAVGQSFNYTVTIDNRGSNAPLTQVFIYDPLQEETTYVSNSTVIGSGLPINSNPSILPGINVGTVAANTLLTVRFSVTLNSFPAQNPILNIATVNYRLDNVPQSQTTNQTQVTARRANIAISKSVNKSFSDLGEVLTYTIITTNTGNVNANNVVLTDIITAGTTFNVGSISSTAAFIGTNLFTGITFINPITPGTTITTTFTVTVNNVIPTPNPISNSATVNYNYIVNPADPAVSGSNTSNTVTTTVNTADLTSLGNFTKSTNRQFADIGDIITYTINLINTGNVSANNVVVTDLIPAGTTFILGSITSTSIPFTGNNPQTGILLSNPIPAGGSVTITFQVRITSIPIVNPIPNQANVNYTYTVDPTNPNGASDSGVTGIVTTQVNNANIGAPGNFVKSVDKTIAQIGDTLTYTLTISNTGNTPTTNVVITDILPNGTSFVAGSITSTVPYSGSNPDTGITLTNPIAPGSTVTITYRVTIIAVPVPNPIPNNADIAYRYIVDPITPVIVNTTATSNEVDTAVSQAILIGPDNFKKSVDLAYADVGDTVTYTISVENTGTVSAAPVQITDSAPTGTTLVSGSVTISDPTAIITELGNNITIDILQIDPGNPPIIVTFQVTVDTIPTQNPILNFSEIEYSYIGPSGVVTESGFTNIASTQVNTADLISIGNFVKNTNKTYVLIGDIVTYQLVVRNTGNVPAVNVTVQDTMPNGLTFVTGSIVSTSPFTGTNIETGITLINPIQPNQSVNITFNAEATSIPVPNPTVNIGNISYEYTVDPAAPNPDATDNGVSNPVSTQIELSEVTTTKTADIDYADVGDTINYTITVTNTGTINASNVVITDLLPNGTVLSGAVNVTIGSTINTTPTSVTINITAPLVPGNSATITFPVDVTSIPVPNPIENSADVTYRYTSDLANPNSAIGSETAGPAQTEVRTADLISTGNFTKSVDKVFADVGGILTYTIRVDNTGTTDANNVVITDLLPNGTNLIGTVSVSVSSNVTTTLTSISVELDNSISPTAAPVIITYQVRVISIPSPNPIVNTADVAYDYIVDPTDPFNITNAGGTTNPVQTTINNADLTSPGNFTKSASLSYADIGDVITYTITVTNTGSTAATATVVADPIESGTTFVPGSITANVPVTGVFPTTGIFITNPIAPGETVIITFQVTVTGVPSPNPILNVANINYSYTVDPINNITATDNGTTLPVTTQVNYADLTSNENFTKSVDRLFSDVNGLITYTLRVRNTGTVPANNVVVVDPIPIGVNIQPPIVVSVLASVNISASEITINLDNPLATTDPDVIITITARVTSIPSTSHVVDQANISYDYIVNPTGPVIATGGGNTNEVSTRINDADLNTSFIKTVDKAYAAVDEVLTYTIITRNTGNTQANNVVITDIIQPGTTFITGSTNANVRILGDNPALGIRILDLVLPTDPQIVITYQVTVISIPIPNTIINVADIIYDYIIDPTTGETDTHTGATLPVTTEVNFADLTSPGNFIKDVDLEYADIGDILTYTFTITNTGNVQSTSTTITDILPIGTEIVPGSVTSSVGIIGVDPEAGIIIINPILPGTTVTVSYRATIVSIPNPNIIRNTADIDYRFTVDPVIPNGGFNSGVSTTANTVVNNANLVVNFNKSVSQEYADVGDILTYTITTTNTGNAPANNVLVTDSILPPGVTFIPGSISSNVLISGNNPQSGISITNPILPGATVSVSFRVTVDTVPVPNPLSNTSDISYRYTVDPANPNGSSGGGTTLPVTTQVNTADLTSPGNFTKTVDKPYADVGDTLTYTVVATNTGNTNANNVLITDILPNGTSFIIGSIVSTAPYTGSSLQTGLTLTNPIIPGGTVTINYQARILSIPNPNPIENTANISYRYTVNPSVPNGVTDSGTSTIATTQINTADLTSPGNFVKTVSDKYTIVEDILTYILTIRNTGNVPANNVQVIDVIPPGTSFIPPIISTIGFIGDNIQTGITLTNPIIAGGTATITFNVRVDEIPTPNPILNTANINYTYTVDPVNENGSSDSGNSNQVSSFVICEEEEISECLFKFQEEINVANINIPLSSVKGSIISRKMDRSKIVYKAYGPPTIKVSGYNLYLDINLNYDIRYNSFKEAKFNEITTVTIFIPEDMSDEILNEEINIENTEFFIEGSKKGFLVVTRMLICVYINS